MERKFMILLSIIDKKEFVMNLFFQKNENSLSQNKNSMENTMARPIILFPDFSRFYFWKYV